MATLDKRQDSLRRRQMDTHKIIEIITDEDGHVYIPLKHVHTSNWLVKQHHDSGQAIPEQDSAEVSCSNLTKTGSE